MLSTKPKPKPSASTLKHLVRGGLVAAVPLMVIALAFVFAPREGSYLVETPAGRAIADHRAAALPPAPAVQGPGLHDVTLLGPDNPAGRTGAAIRISPSAVGSTNTNLRIVGFDRALVDEGKFSRFDQVEAYRSRTDVPGSEGPASK